MYFSVISIQEFLMFSICAFSENAQWSILLKNTFDKLKTKFTSANSKLSDRLINVEKKGFANEQYSRRECLEISGIPPLVSTRKFYIRRNNNEVDSIETRRIVIAHFLP